MKLLDTGSIRTKLLLLVAGVALMVGAASAVYSSLKSGQVLRNQLEAGGKYIASNLAKNSQYGVLTEDKPLLNNQIENVITANTSVGQTSDVVGVMVQDAKGAVLFVMVDW